MTRAATARLARAILPAAAAGAALLSGGCVMAVRHLAKAVNRSDAEARLHRRFPAGTSMDQVRTAMADDGYACAAAPATAVPDMRLTCRPTHPRRTAATLLAGGNWTLDFYSRDDVLIRVHANAKRRPPAAPG